MNSLRKLIPLLLFSTCLLAGFRAGRAVVPTRAAAQLRSQIARSQPAPVPPETPPAVTGQRNLLVILVDRLEAVEPRLQGVWLVLSIQGQPQAMILPVYPTAGGAEEPLAHPGLPERVRLAPDGGPGADFLAALGAKQLWWNAYILVDEAGLAELLEWVDPESGASAVSGLPPTWEDPHGALAGQFQLAQALCRSAGQRLPAALTPVLRLVPQHLATDLDLQAAASDWPGLLARRGSLSCDFPTLAASLEE